MARSLNLNFADIDITVFQQKQMVLWQNIKSMQENNPLIIVFACQWCAYQGADQAGSLKLSYPTNVYIIKVPCTGRIEPEFIIEALSKGADGVFVGGCHSGECHYKDGNIKAKMRISLLKQVLQEAGFEQERIKTDWISAGEGRKFAQAMIDFTEKLKTLKRIKENV